MELPSPAAPASTDPGRAGAWRRAALLFGLAFLYRLLLALWTTTIATDGTLYLSMAEAFAQGRVTEALGGFRGVHPLYPLLIALCGSPFGAFEAAGYAIAVLAGASAVVPLYFLARAWWNDRVALMSGLLYAFHPTLSSEGSEVMTTSLFLGLFVAAAALIVFAYRTRSCRLFVLAGIATGLCYLTRPEGLLLLPVFGGAMLLRLAGLFRPVATQNSAVGHPVLEATAFLLAVALVGGPYVVWIHSHTGKWSLTLRPSARVVLESSDGENPGVPAPQPAQPLPSKTVEAPPPPPSSPRANSWIEVGRRLAVSLYAVLLPFYALGLLFMRRSGVRWRALAAPIAIALLTLAPPFVLFVVSGGTYAISRRYFLSASVFLLPWAAAGLIFVADAITVRAGGGGWFRRVPAGHVLLAIVLLVLVAKTLGPRRAEEVTFVEAGRWLRQLAGGRPGAVLVSRDKLAYYAGARAVAIPPTDVDAMPGAAERYAIYLAGLGRREGAAYLLLDERGLRKLPPGLPEALASASFRLERRFPEEGAATRAAVNAVRVYKLP